MIMTMSKIKNGVANADDIEAVVALRAIQMVFHIGVSNIIQKWDSMWVVDALKSFGTNMSRQGPLFKEIKVLMHHVNKF